MLISIEKLLFDIVIEGNGYSSDEDAIELSNSKYEELFNALNAGCLIFDDLSVSPPPPKPKSDYDWDTGLQQWVFNQQAHNERLEQERQQVWERIKQHRLDNSKKGVFIEKYTLNSGEVVAVNKWFQTDDEEIDKYNVLGKSLTRVRSILSKMYTKEQLQSNGGMLIPWTTYDNSYVDMTEELLDEIMVQITVKTLFDHTVAAHHKADLWKSENPLNYDYSQGWQPNYGG